MIVQINSLLNYKGEDVFLFHPDALSTLLTDFLTLIIPQTAKSHITGQKIQMMNSGVPWPTRSLPSITGIRTTWNFR